MYTQRNYLLQDLEAALAKKVKDANATAIGAVELRIGNDGRVTLCTTVIFGTGASYVISLDL